jgi:hypothetical protein
MVKVRNVREGCVTRTFARIGDHADDLRDELARFVDVF